MVIGIGGVSRSGKTKLAKLIKENLSNYKTIILSQDDYVYSLSEIPLVNDVTDWESPKSINFDLLIDKISAIKAVYDFIIVEGFLAFHNTQLNTFYDKFLFMKINKQVFLERRQVDDRWEKEPDWYMEYVWRSYIKYGQLPKGFDNLTIKGDTEVPMNQVLSYLNIKVYLSQIK